MKRIGAGWQYVVYDLGNGRVRKVPRPGWEQAIFVSLGLMSQNPLGLRDLPAELRRINRDTTHSIELLQRFLPHIDPSLFGNPTFLETPSFEQDKVEPLGAYFRRATLEQKQEAFDGYVKLIEELWKYGLAETTFNFSLNTGRTESGQIIQIDLGEFTDSKADVLKAIETASWQTQFSFLSLEQTLKPYAFERMKATMTIENFERHWKQRSAG